MCVWCRSIPLTQTPPGARSIGGTALTEAWKPFDSQTGSGSRQWHQVSVSPATRAPDSVPGHLLIPGAQRFWRSLLPGISSIGRSGVMLLPPASGTALSQFQAAFSPCNPSPDPIVWVSLLDLLRFVRRHPRIAWEWCIFPLCPSIGRPPSIIHLFACPHLPTLTCPDTPPIQSHSSLLHHPFLCTCIIFRHPFSLQPGRTF